MMKMDGRDSAECQNWENRKIKVIFELFKLDIGQKNATVLSPPLTKEKNVNWRKKEMQN